MFLHRYFCVLFFFACINHLVSQNCVPTVIVFSIQEHVENFPSNYPGCTTINGNVEISDDEVTHLDSLAQVTMVDGDVLINATNLNDIQGLSNVTPIGGYLRIWSQPFKDTINFSSLVS